MKIKQAPLSKFVKINPEGITQGYPYQAIEYIDISSVGSGQLVEQPEEILLKDAPSRAKRIVRNKDIILATVRPNLRSFLFIKNPNDNTIVSTGFAVLRTKESADSRFIYYAITDSRFTGYLTNNTKGTSYPAVDSDIVLRGDIPDFDFKRQQYIGDILSSYDDLIDTNRRRIQLLEESARLLFREWFVYCRFPGHEKVKMVDGVPEEWKKEKLIKIGYLNYGKALVEETREEGDVKVYGSSGAIGVHSKPLVEGPGIIVGRKGNVGAIHWVNDSYWPIDTVYYIKKEQSNLFLYLSLKVIGFINTDASVPGLNRDYAHNKTILVPTKDLLDKFLHQVNEIYSMVKVLSIQNQKFAQARDLLLPRLMSGVIEV